MLIFSARLLPTFEYFLVELQATLNFRIVYWERLHRQSLHILVEILHNAVLPKFGLFRHCIKR